MGENRTAHDILEAVRKLLDAGDSGASAVLTADEARAIMVFARPRLLDAIDRELAERIPDAKPRGGGVIGSY